MLPSITSIAETLTESASSCSVATLMQGKIRFGAQENVVVVLCGANIALEKVQAWMRTA